jgi:hypothetical protein
MSAPTIEHLEVAAYTIATDEAESDGTLQWDSTNCGRQSSPPPDQ